MQLESLLPSERVNRLFGELVKYSISNKKITLSNNEIDELQKLCSESEYELEKYWASRILKSKAPVEELHKFPYIQNYKKLTKMEWHGLLGCSEHTAHTVLFIGGGPLPLTAILLAELYNVEVTILEKNPEAVTQSRQLLKEIHLDRKVTVLCVDATQFTEYSHFNVIFVAALAGVEGTTKSKILKSIKRDTKYGSHILVRSSWGTRELLYRPIDSTVYKLFHPLIEVRPHNDIVNSVVIFQT